MVADGNMLFMQLGKGRSDPIGAWVVDVSPGVPKNTVPGSGLDPSSGIFSGADRKVALNA